MNILFAITLALVAPQDEFRAGFAEVQGCRNTTPLDAVLALKGS